MAVFAYKVARPDGTTLSGDMEGDSEHTVRAKLEGQGFLVFRLRPLGSISRPSQGLFRNRGKLPYQEFLVFNQELLALVKAGLPILKIWDLLIERSRHLSFQNALQTVRQDIRGGVSTSDALARHPRHFTDLYVATIKAGEQSGNLPEVLQRYIVYLKLMIDLRQKVTKALAYPAFLIIVGVAVIGFLLTYVMPTFVVVYGESAQSLPAATKALIEIAGASQSYLLPVGIGIGALALGFRMWHRTPAGRLSTDRVLLRLPLLGTIFIQHHTIQLTRTLATVLTAGTPLVEAMQIARGSVSNRCISSGLVAAIAQIREGSTLAAALAGHNILPKMAIEMLSVGEETGSLETMLRDVASFYEADLDIRLSQLTTWIEPILLLVMGVFVGAIVIIMYLPVFQMAGSV